MIYLIIGLVGLGVVVALGSLLFGKKGADDAIVQSDVATCATCNGDDPKCEQECMMEASTKEIEYFDDEELDRYAGRPSEQYTDEEADEFAEVMYTMQPKEVKDWNRSLILRGINFPNQLKDELINLIDS